MVSTPFVIFYLIGMTLQSGLPYPAKALILAAVAVFLHFSTRYVFDERLINILPMSVYLATKVSYLQVSFALLVHLFAIFLRWPPLSHR